MNDCYWPSVSREPKSLVVQKVQGSYEASSTDASTSSTIQCYSLRRYQGVSQSNASPSLISIRPADPYTAKESAQRHRMCNLGRT